MLVPRTPLSCADFALVDTRILRPRCVNCNGDFAEDNAVAAAAAAAAAFVVLPLRFVVLRGAAGAAGSDEEEEEEEDDEDEEDEEEDDEDEEDFRETLRGSRGTPCGASLAPMLFKRR